MKPLSEKIFLSLTMPTEDVPISDQTRIRLALNDLGYDAVTFSLEILQKLYPTPTLGAELHQISAV